MTPADKRRVADLDRLEDVYSERAQAAWARGDDGEAARLRGQADEYAREADRLRAAVLEREGAL